MPTANVPFAPQRWDEKGEGLQVRKQDNSAQSGQSYLGGGRDPFISTLNWISTGAILYLCGIPSASWNQLPGKVDALTLAEQTSRPHALTRSVL